MFTLNFKAFNKAAKTTHTKKESIYVKKNVIGVIHINIAGQYYININDTNYVLSNNSYNCKDKTTLYYRWIKDGNRLRVITLNGFPREELVDYLPFTVGVICKGNLIKENLIVKFDLKETIKYDEDFKQESKDAFKFFRDNYEEIKNVCRSNEEKVGEQSEQ